MGYVLGKIFLFLDYEGVVVSFVVIDIMVDEIGKIISINNYIQWVSVWNSFFLLVFDQLLVNRLFIDYFLNFEVKIFFFSLLYKFSIV